LTGAAKAIDELDARFAPLWKASGGEAVCAATKALTTGARALRGTPAPGGTNAATWTDAADDVVVGADAITTYCATRDRDATPAADHASLTALHDALGKAIARVPGAPALDAHAADPIAAAPVPPMTSDAGKALDELARSLAPVWRLDKAHSGDAMCAAAKTWDAKATALASIAPPPGLAAQDWQDAANAVHTGTSGLLLCCFNQRPPRSADPATQAGQDAVDRDCLAAVRQGLALAIAIVPDAPPLDAAR
jgi:hypothetical protein